MEARCGPCLFLRDKATLSYLADRSSAALRPAYVPPSMHRIRAYRAAAARLQARRPSSVACPPSARPRLDLHTTTAKCLQGQATPMSGPGKCDSSPGYCIRIVALATRNQGRDAVIDRICSGFRRRGRPAGFTGVSSRLIPSHHRIRTVRWVGRSHRLWTARRRFSFPGRYPAGCSTGRNPSGTATRFQVPRRSRRPLRAPRLRVFSFHALATDYLSASGLLVCSCPN
jgi:hypothetical protein